VVAAESNIPSAPPTVPADFERQSALLIGVNELLPLHPHVLTGLVSALIDRLPLIAVITGEEQRRDLLATLCDWGLPAHRLRAVRSSAAGLWVRDYGPQFIRRDQTLSVIDAEYGYTGGRPDDDQFPTDLARLLGLEVESIPLKVDGGNLLSNGRGLLLTTTGVVNRNAGNFTPQQVMSQLNRRYGFRQIACPPPLIGGPTAHSDMFATFTAPDTLLLGRYDPADDPVNAPLLDRVADGMRGMDSGAGPLKVERIPMPPHRDGVWRTYTNAVYANDTVVVPVYAGVDERIEREALDAYRRLLPGRAIIPVEATSLARTGGALRCVTLNIPHLGHPIPLEESSGTLFATTRTPPRPSHLDAFVTPPSQGWYGPRRSVLQMEA
jgi:agmatine deiminase